MYVAGGCPSHCDGISLVMFRPLKHEQYSRLLENISFNQGFRFAIVELSNTFLLAVYIGQLG